MRRVFVTSDLGTDFLPKWLTFLKVIVDGERCRSSYSADRLTVMPADDLPITAGRDSIQANQAVIQIKRTVARKVTVSCGALDMC